MRKAGRGEIKKLSDLFLVYQTRLKAPQGVVIKAFQEVIHDLFTINIKKEQCEYVVSSKTIHINLPGPFKSEILIRKKEILNHLTGRLGEKSAPKDIL